MPPAIYEFKEFRLHIKRKQLFRQNGEKIALTPQAFDLLLFFIENKGETFSNDELITKVWGRIVESGNVTENVSVINRKLKPHKFIINIPGRGYYFEESSLRTIDDEDLEKYPDKESFLSNDLTVQISEENRNKTVFDIEEKKTEELNKTPDKSIQPNQDITIQSEEFYDSDKTQSDNLKVADTKTQNSSEKRDDSKVKAKLKSIFKKWWKSNKFNQWIFDYNNKLMLFVLFCIVATFTSSFFLINKENQYSSSIVSGIQAFIILLAALYPIYDLEDVSSKIPDEKSWNELSEIQKKSTGYNTFKEWNDGSPIAEGVLEQYKVWWKVILISWIFLYLCFIGTGHPKLKLQNFLPKPSESEISVQVINSDSFLKNAIWNENKSSFALNNASNQYRNGQSFTIVLANYSIETPATYLSFSNSNQINPSRLKKTVCDLNLTLVNPQNDISIGKFSYSDGKNNTQQYFNGFVICASGSNTIPQRMNLDRGEIEISEVSSGKITGNFNLGLNDQFIISTDKFDCPVIYAADESTKQIITGMSIFSTFVNNLSSFAIFICFSLLYSRSKLGKDKKPQIHNTIAIGAVVVLIFSVIESCFIWFRSEGLQQASEILRVFSGVSGIAAATIMALYFGRLQSKLLNPPLWLINLLFVYTAIQSLFLILDTQTWGIVLMDAALFFKSLLFLYMNFLFISGRLFFYLVRIRKTYEHVDDEFDNFNVILNK
jgi:DNA-binding winged helix-turn-helix (wHTH) protein